MSGVNSDSLRISGHLAEVLQHLPVASIVLHGQAVGQVEAVVTGSYSISWSAPRLARPSEDGSEWRSSPGEGHLTSTGSLEVNDLRLSSKPLSM